MTSSLYLAQLIGPTKLLVAMGMLFNRGYARALAVDVLDRPGLLFLAGLLALVPGLAIVDAHNLWVADWRVIITVLGWAMVIAGVDGIARLRFTCRGGSASPFHSSEASSARVATC